VALLKEKKTSAPDTSTTELQDTKTDLFLSHRRLTAQVIAGRLYEGLKGSHKIFLDSEAKFKVKAVLYVLTFWQLHSLEELVNRSSTTIIIPALTYLLIDIFVCILSDGYLESEWCLKELKAAYKYKKKVIL
jgi:hypothetical protein